MGRALRAAGGGPDCGCRRHVIRPAAAHRSPRPAWWSVRRPPPPSRLHHHHHHHHHHRRRRVVAPPSAPPPRARRTTQTATATVAAVAAAAAVAVAARRRCGRGRHGTPPSRGRRVQPHGRRHARPPGLAVQVERRHGQRHRPHGPTGDRGWRRQRRHGRHDDDGLVGLRVGGAQVVHNGHHHTDVDRRQPAGDRVGGPAPAAPRHHQLLRRVAGVRRHAGRDGRDDVQRQQADQRQVDVRLLHVRRVELERRVLQHRVHTAPVLHQRGPVLRHRQAAQVPGAGHQAAGRLPAAGHVGRARRHSVRAHILRLVHHRRVPGLSASAPGRLRLGGEQGVRDRLVVHIVLDTVHDHVVHVPRDIQGGEPAGEADPRADQLRPPDELQPGDGGEPAAGQRRGQRVVVQDHAGAQRPPLDPVPGQQEHYQDEEGTQGGQDVGHHHGHVHRLLAAVLPVVRDHDAVRRDVQHITVGGGRVLLDRLLQLDAEPADLRVLQPGLPGGVQEHAAVRVLQPVPEPAVRPRGARCQATVATVRRPHAQRVFGDVPEPLRPASVQPVRQQLMIRRAVTAAVANPRTPAPRPQPVLALARPERPTVCLCPLLTEKNTPSPHVQPASHTTVHTDPVLSPLDPNFRGRARCFLFIFFFIIVLKNIVRLFYPPSVSLPPRETADITALAEHNVFTLVHILYVCSI